MVLLLIKNKKIGIHGRFYYIRFYVHFYCLSYLYTLLVRSPNENEH